MSSKLIIFSEGRGRASIIRKMTSCVTWVNLIQHKSAGKIIVQCKTLAVIDFACSPSALTFVTARFLVPVPCIFRSAPRPIDIEQGLSWCVYSYLSNVTHRPTRTHSLCVSFFLWRHIQRREKKQITRMFIFIWVNRKRQMRGMVTSETSVNGKRMNTRCACLCLW